MLEILQKPNNLSKIGSTENWFSLIAQELLNNYNLIAKNEKYRLVEIEFYCYAQEHPDVFSHQDKLQQEFGRWYFHRHGGKYKGGSFKGLDLTFGDTTMYCSILIRTIEKADGSLICGPSLCVDNLLAATESENVSQLDEKIACRIAWDEENIIYLQKTKTENFKNYQNHQIFSSARVGLSLKKAKLSSTMPWYILRPYRYLREPKLISKGKVYLVLALHYQGISPEKIHQIIGSPKHSISKYIADFEEGRKEDDFSPYIGIDLNTEKLCKLHGTWYEKINSFYQN
ncbi:MAG: hypothetical protein QNJ47_04560 [Nostocaceae cyanobacterium]|nr:hypothetical protein [Nostocaceae cyanobacterium]